jgi:hypothetical protein
MSIRHSSIPFIAILLLAPTLIQAQTLSQAQTKPTVTYRDSHPIAEVITGFSIQAADDLNRSPACQYQSLPCLTPTNAPARIAVGGVALSGGLFPTNTIGMVAEASLYDNTWLAYGTNCPAAVRASGSCTAEQTDHVRSLLAGARFRTAPFLVETRKVRLFVQLLGGQQWNDLGPSHFVIQPSAGLDDYIFHGTAIVHAEYGYRRVLYDRRDQSTRRFLIGIGVPIGSI